MNCPTLAEYSALFPPHGGTDFPYLAGHYRRFCVTRSLFESTWQRRGLRLLDVGAHWLHQSLLYARDGYAVTATDLPVTMALPAVQSLARASGITLIENADLERPAAFRHLPDASFDVILFTEIIEHLTFNPVAMWTEFHRLLAIGGRIVVTTPNYHALGSRFWDLRRLLRRMGGGITVDEILQRHTHGHHWKEFSLRELLRYFALLSPDFVAHKAAYVEAFDEPEAARHRQGWLARRVCRRLPLVRPNLHVEIELAGKQRGIVVTPSW